MFGQFLAAACCLLCALPFWVIGATQKESKSPIAFWSGDDSLKHKVTDIPAYNAEMAGLYKQYGAAWLADAVLFPFSGIVGIVLMVLNSTLGIVLLYRRYKSILAKYS